MGRVIVMEEPGPDLARGLTPSEFAALPPLVYGSHKPGVTAAFILGRAITRLHQEQQRHRRARAASDDPYSSSPLEAPAAPFGPITPHPLPGRDRPITPAAPTTPHPSPGRNCFPDAPAPAGPTTPHPSPGRDCPPDAPVASSGAGPSTLLEFSGNVDLSPFPGATPHHSPRVVRPTNLHLNNLPHGANLNEVEPLASGVPSGELKMSMLSPGPGQLQTEVSRSRDVLASKVASAAPIPASIPSVLGRATVAGVRLMCRQLSDLSSVKFRMFPVLPPDPSESAPSCTICLDDIVDGSTVQHLPRCRTSPNASPSPNM